MRRTALLAVSLHLLFAGISLAQSREDKVRNDKKTVEADGFWIYNDLPRAFDEAKKANKPMLVVLRCIPCEECVKLDDDLVNKDPRVRPLLEQFIRVRVVSTNGLDLGLFQFDTDQSFAGFILNADGTIYGRYGTRSHRTYWSDDVSVEGLARALEGAIELHKQYPANKAELAARRGPAPSYPSPEKFPSLSSKYTATLDYGGKVVQSCIHCHQIGDAMRQHFRDRNQPIPEQILFSYPHPKTLGLILDPKERATVLRAEKGSPAEKSGFQPNDRIVKLAGQPLLSIADVQWILHHTTPADEGLKAIVQRDGKTIETTLVLPKGWRQREDVSWRASTWGLRRMATGGMLLENLPADVRAKLELPETAMALRVKHVGQFGAHAAAKNAGVRAGDIVVSFDGRADFASESDLIAHGVTARKAGDMAAVTVLRDGKKVELKVPMQK